MYKSDAECRNQMRGLGNRLLLSTAYTKEGYRELVRKAGAEYCFLVGWTTLTHGLDPRGTITAQYILHNPDYAAVLMHFVNIGSGRGPVFFEQKVSVMKTNTADQLMICMAEVKRRFYARVGNLVLAGRISWDGEDPASLRVPSCYPVSRSVSLMDNDRLIFDLSVPFP